MLSTLRTHGEQNGAALAHRLGLSRTVVGRLLATLEDGGYVRRTPGGFDLGFTLLELAANVEPSLRAAARPALELLAGQFGETALLAVRDGDDAVAVDQVVADGAVVQVRYRTGYRHPVGVAAHGRALLPDARATVVTAGELEPGTKGVAAPVRGPSGAVIASIGVVAPEHRFPPEAEVVEAVRRAAEGVELELQTHDGRGGSDAVVPASR